MAKKNRNKDTNSRRRRGPGTRTTSEPILLIVQGKIHCAFDEVNRETTSTAMPHLITELIKLKPKTQPK